jgi:8-oxo-dGTP diphosphatase
MPYTYEYERPAVTVDMVIVAHTDQGHEVLLIERGEPPFKGKWALPGGFLDIDEELHDAAARELEEETGLTGIAMGQLGAYGKVGRDPRGRTVSVVYMAVVRHKPPARAGDDAAKVGWFPLNNLPDLAFDHTEILRDAVLRV